MPALRKAQAVFALSFVGAQLYPERSEGMLRPPRRKARLCAVPSWPATMGLRHILPLQKKKPRSKIPILSGLASGRLRRTLKKKKRPRRSRDAKGSPKRKTPSAKPGRTFLHELVYHKTNFRQEILFTLS
jgi:hypothetical protein